MRLSPEVLRAVRGAYLRAFMVGDENVMGQCLTMLRGHTAALGIPPEKRSTGKRVPKWLRDRLPKGPRPGTPSPSRVKPAYRK